MASRNDTDINTEDDVDLLNSAVDEFFSFIYDEPCSDHETFPEDLSQSHDDGIDKVVDEHFSFLDDQDCSEQFISCEPIYNNLLQNDRASSVSCEEPIYSNLPTYKINVGDEPTPCGESLLIPLDDDHKETSSVRSPQILDIYVPGDSIYQSPPLDTPEVINIPVISEDTSRPEGKTSPSPKERKSSVYLNGDACDKEGDIVVPSGDNQSNETSTPFTISFSSDVDTPSIYTFTAPEGGSRESESGPSICPGKWHLEPLDDVKHNCVSESFDREETLPCDAEDDRNLMQDVQQVDKTSEIAETESHKDNEYHSENLTLGLIPNIDKFDSSTVVLFPLEDQLEVGRPGRNHLASDIQENLSEDVGDTLGDAKVNTIKNELSLSGRGKNDDSALLDAGHVQEVKSLDQREIRTAETATSSNKVVLISLLNLNYPEILVKDENDIDSVHCPSGSNPHTPLKRTDTLEDLERLRQLDLEMMQLETDVQQIVSTSNRKVGLIGDTDESVHCIRVDEIVEAVNPTVLPSSCSVSSTHINFPIVELIRDNIPEETSTRCGLLTLPRPQEHLHREILVAQSSTSVGDEEQDTESPYITTEAHSSGTFAPTASNSNGTSESHSNGTSDPSNLSASAVSRAIRRSLRRLRDGRLSGRRSRRTEEDRAIKGGKKKSFVSEETVVRRQLPSAPEVGLPSVRSPGASAILLPSLLAALTPNDPPREVLPSPGHCTPSSTHTRHDSAPSTPLRSGQEFIQPVSSRTSQQSEPHSSQFPTINTTPIIPSTATPTCTTTAPSCSATGSCSQPEAPETRNTFGAESGIWYTPITSYVVSNTPQWRNGSVNGAYASTESRDNNRTPGRENTSQHTPGRDTNTQNTPVRSNHGTRSNDASSTPNRRSHSHGGGAANAPGRRGDGHNRRNERTRRHSRSQNGSDASTPHPLVSSDSTHSVNSDSNNNSSSDVVTSPSNSSSGDNNTRSSHSRQTSGSPSRQISTSSQISERTTDSRLLNRSRDSLDLSRTHLSRSRSPSRGFIPPKRGVWPHSCSGLLASLAVTVTMFNISRFAVLGAHFGWQFPIQWVVISLVLGIPLMTFHAALGQYIGGTAIDMWVISPIFQGVGYGLMLAECVLGIYCCVPVAWLFTYFRDSFDLRSFRCLESLGCNTAQNLSSEINNIVPRFFTSTVLQKYEDGPLLSPSPSSSPSPTPSLINSLGSVKFDLSFNIALIWVITFLALSRGARSYGKVCYIIFLLPSVCYLAVCGNLIYWITSEVDITKFKAHFLDRHSWMAASREAFLVWGLHGAVIQQIAANNKRRHRLWRDTTILALVTITFLGLASFCGLLCSSLMEKRNLIYRASSFEDVASRGFTELHPKHRVNEGEEGDSSNPFGGGFSPHPMGPPTHDPASRSNLAYDNFYVGIKIRNRYSHIMPRHMKSEDARSGYNVLRFLTELFPAMLLIKEDAIMPLWPPLFFMGFLLFGIAQQFAVWHCVVQGVIRLNYEKLREWETFITFCCCVFGFSAALPMATGVGIHIVFFLDYLIGCAWWIMILQLIQIFAVLFVRGKPCSAQEMAHRLLDKCRCCCTSLSWLSAPVSLAWTILIPVGLLVLSISSFQTGNYREIFAWESDYWPTWTCQLASGLQLLPLFLVPMVGLIQTCRYLSDPRQDLFQRIQHLYRPPQHTDQEEDDETYLTQRSDEDLEALQLPYSGANPPPGAQQNRAETQPPRPYSDPPPKYTPPPSYSTATGSSLFKLLNRSVRGMRYLQNTLRQASSPPPPVDRGAPPENPPDTTVTPTRSEPYIPPPDYPRSSSRLLPIATIQGHTNATTSSSNPIQPPQYSTLDPLRRHQRNNPSIVPPLFPLGKDRFGEDSAGVLSSLVGHRSRAGAFSRRSSLRGSSDFRRSLRNSLRHSARRLAATFSGGGVITSNTAPSNLPSARACSNLELTSHSEA